MFGTEKKKLVVVYNSKDEVALNYFKKLVETNDDTEKEVGSKDNTVSLLAWNEKVYEDNKKMGNISNKIIYLGEVKGVKNIIPIMDEKFSENGIIYGFAGNQAVIYVNENALGPDDKFKRFQKDYDKLMKSINEKVKRLDKSKELELHQSAKAAKVAAAILTFTYPVVGIPMLIGAVITDSVDRKNLREKMFLYGITQFYLNELDSFMNS